MRGAVASQKRLVSTSVWWILCSLACSSFYRHNNIQVDHVCAEVSTKCEARSHGSHMVFNINWIILYYTYIHVYHK